MQLLISDANILIDLEEGRVLERLFQLPYHFSVPDVLFAEELENQHGYLLEMGLSQRELSPQSLQYAAGLIAHATGVSSNDCFALALAKQEQCPLLTGDQRLRGVAEQEGVVVMGTIWVINQLVQHQYLSIRDAKDAYERMRTNGRRLPWELAFRSLDELMGQ
ncbi:PIN domain-containing protein [Aidingimonas halophila]|uniref:rRNA-processing protein FCF1 n=1 Tax=Aidingimonas halophila TaxID=574349 RepID=A0A1H3FKM9_9GAMM|nr:PIN domain-containing protein [Aidingimonas halophila]GHC37675.1 hypothetical protein GCM10008094_33690 [Aidingimonas halophila]SDX91337.1 rRNA-processing protein FCF1 [Aidingimonas halophila]